MNIEDALRPVRLLYIETAPIIYFVEDHAVYADKMAVVMGYATTGRLRLLTSTLTRTETLAKPIQQQDKEIEDKYRELFDHGRNFFTIAINNVIADRAAALRARYGLRSPDALHLATSIASGCEAFLTNDHQLRRVSETTILVLDDLELPASESPVDS